MRAEGDIANLIVQAVVWRRIGLMRDASTGVILIGRPNDAHTTLLATLLHSEQLSIQEMEEAVPEDAPMLQLERPTVLADCPRCSLQAAACYTSQRLPSVPMSWVSQSVT